MTEEAAPADVTTWNDDVVQRGFDITADLPVQVVLGMVSPTGSVLVIVVHLVAGDERSMAPLTRDLARAYAACHADGPGLATAAAPLRGPCAAAAGTPGPGGQPRQRAEPPDPDWHRALAGLSAVLALPRYRPRSAHAPGRGVVLRFHVDAELHRAVTALAADSRVTVFMVVQAALAVTLRGLGAGDVIPLGTPVTDRTPDVVVGHFGNLLMLRTDLSADPTFRQVWSASGNPAGPPTSTGTCPSTPWSSQSTRPAPPTTTRSSRPCSNWRSAPAPIRICRCWT